MICASLGKTTPEKILKAAGSADLVEVRLDLNEFTPEDIKRIFGSSPNLIATFRRGRSEESVRLKSLQAAVGSGAGYIDLDGEEDNDFVREVTRKPGGNPVRLILSYHNHSCTPDEEELDRIAGDLFSRGADIAKIACKVNTQNDNLALLSLYGKHRNIIVIGMGISGRITRLAACFLGAPFTYASCGNEKTEEGQIDHIRLKEMIAELKNG